MRMTLWVDKRMMHFFCLHSNTSFSKSKSKGAAKAANCWTTKKATLHGSSRQKKKEKKEKAKEPFKNIKLAKKDNPYVISLYRFLYFPIFSERIVSTEECNNNSSLFSNNYRDKEKGRGNEEWKRYRMIGISFLRSTFVSLRRNRQKEKRKKRKRREQDGKTFPSPCHYRTLQHINCMILEVFPFPFPPSLPFSFFSIRRLLNFFFI